MYSEKLADLLLALTEERVNLLDDVAYVTEGQSDLIELDDLQPLLDSIDQRQYLIDRASEIDGQIARVEQDMGEPCDTHEWQALMRKLATLHETARVLLEKTVRIDESNSRNLREKLQYFQQEMRSLKEGERGMNAYSGIQHHSEGIYIDKKDI